MQEAMAKRKGRDLKTLAQDVVGERIAAKEFIYGVGHSIHSQGDPRADRLFAIARECGVHGEYCELIGHISEATSAAHGKLRPVNVTGALAAISSDLGLGWKLAKSFALIGRCLGALGHIREETENPVADDIKKLVTRSVDYVPPKDLGPPPATHSPA
jgi:citrate synthase